MTLAELSAKAGVSARTIRYYTTERVLPATEFRGRATRYVRGHFICLVAIKALRRTHRWPLHKIRQYIRTTPSDDVERFAATVLPELAAKVAPAATSAVAAPPATSLPASSLALSDTWQRFTVVPGLEVHLHASASAEVKTLARTLMERVRAG
jgi:DNA-binding transcriptional MerR regulator